MPAAAEAQFYNAGQYEGRTVTFDALRFLQANDEARTLCGAKGQRCATEFFINSKL